MLPSTSTAVDVWGAWHARLWRPWYAVRVGGGAPYSPDRSDAEERVGRSRDAVPATTQSLERSSNGPRRSGPATLPALDHSATAFALGCVYQRDPLKLARRSLNRRRAEGCSRWWRPCRRCSRRCTERPGAACGGRGIRSRWWVPCRRSCSPGPMYVAWLSRSLLRSDPAPCRRRPRAGTTGLRSAGRRPASEDSCHLLRPETVLPSRACHVARAVPPSSGLEAGEVLDRAMARLERGDGPGEGPRVLSAVEAALVVLRPGGLALRERLVPRQEP